MKQEDKQVKYKEILRKRLPKKIDSNFIKRFYGKINQARLGLNDLNEFEDALLMNGLSGIDCTEIDFSELTKEEFENLPFDSSTIFPEEVLVKFEPAEILEKGKKFGLGLENVPLTGKGIHIAIRDEDCNPYLIDANIVDYTRIINGKVIKQVNSDDVEHMHGKATTSLLASKSCGVAKDSAVHFFDGTNGTIEEYVEYIIEYNQKCKDENRENEMILVASGSWNDPEFINHRNALRKAGCELICANNFDKNFNEFTSNGGNIKCPLDFSQDELNILIKKYPERESVIRAQAERKNNTKIPISRTYHQVGENGGFKYQSAYSTSWGIPQVAGLFAIFKELDRNITFEQFCEIASKTAEGEMKIINPQGIYKEIERIIEERKTKGKNGFDDCMQCDVRTPEVQVATETVKKFIQPKDRGLNEQYDSKE